MSKELLDRIKNSNCSEFEKLKLELEYQKVYFLEDLATNLKITNKKLDDINCSIGILDSHN